MDDKVELGAELPETASFSETSWGSFFCLRCCLFRSFSFAITNKASFSFSILSRPGKTKQLAKGSNNEEIDSNKLEEIWTAIKTSSPEGCHLTKEPAQELI